MGPHRPELSALSEAMIGKYSTLMIGETWITPSMVSLIQTIENCFHTKFPNVKPHSPIVNLSGIFSLNQGVNVKVSFRGEIDQPEENLYLFTNNSLPTVFPIPESFVPENYSRAGRGLDKFPKRFAQPRIVVNTKPEMIALFPDFPCDRIQMAQSPTFDKLSKLPDNTMWLAYVEGSSVRHELFDSNDAFGFFKMSSSSRSNFSGSVSFYLLPYRFKKLFAILKSASTHAKTGIYPPLVQSNFTSYLQGIPSYYWPKISDGLVKCKMKSLWPSSLPMPPIIDEIKVRFADTKIMCKIALERLATYIKESNQDVNLMKIEHNPYNIPVEDLEKQFKLFQARVNSSPIATNPNQMSSASQEELGKSRL
jgi:hypothetical protein